MSELHWSLWDDLQHFDLGYSDSRPGEWHDRKALYFEKKGAVVLLHDALDLDYFRMEAEIACPGPAGFIGLVFGARDSLNYELVYVSPGIDTGLGEIQYDPIMNGSSTWQIYNGARYQAPAPFSPGVWSKLSLDVQLNSVAITVGENVTPQLVIPNLQHGRSTGKIGVWGYLPGYIRNLTVEKIQPASIDRTEPDLAQLAAETFVTEWLVSKPYLNNGQREPEHKWIRTFVEENGTLNLNRLYPSEQGISVQAKSTFYIPEERESMLTFGFSDCIRLWVNDEEIYQGEWKWGPPHTDGRIRDDFEGIAIRWKSGINTIRAEITSQEVVFGWGLSVKSGLPNLSFLS